MKKVCSTTDKILKFIKGIASQNGFPPTLREIASGVGLRSTWTVRYHLKKLVDTGQIKLKKRISRGIEILSLNNGIPVLGRIRAGQPEEAIENADEYITDIREFFGIKDIFALRIKGDSMEGAGIFDGDIVIVKRQNSAHDGDIVVALLENEATVKRFYMTENGIKLVPENSKYSPIISKDIKILGRVTGVIRKY